MISAQMMSHTGSPYATGTTPRSASRCPYLNGTLSQDTTATGSTQHDPGIYSLRPLSGGEQSTQGENLSSVGFRTGIESAVACANSSALSGTVGACPKMSS